MEHAPGPWEVAHGTWIYAKGDCVAIGSHAIFTQEASTANVNLIAAAPDLLEALEAMLDAQSARKHPLGTPDEGIATICAEAASKARAATSKAKGKS